jgi:hypothetical protein
MAVTAAQVKPLNPQNAQSLQEQKNAFPPTLKLRLFATLIANLSESAVQLVFLQDLQLLVLQDLEATVTSVKIQSLSRTVLFTITQTRTAVTAQQMVKSFVR